jgi:serine/threonine-protein kinase RsbW
MTFTTTINCQKSELRTLREFIVSSLSFTLEEKRLTLFSVAVEEVCMNLMGHGHHYDPNQNFQVLLRVTDSEVQAEIVDAKAEFFDICAYTPPEITQIVRESRKGSMGLLLVKRICDSITIEKFNSGGSVCRLTKKLA